MLVFTCATCICRGGAVSLDMIESLIFGASYGLLLVLAYADSFILDA